MTNEENAQRSRFIRGLVFEAVADILHQQNIDDITAEKIEIYKLSDEESELFQKVFTDFKYGCISRAENLLKKEDDK